MKPFSYVMEAYARYLAGLDPFLDPDEYRIDDPTQSHWTLEEMITCPYDAALERACVLRTKYNA